MKQAVAEFMWDEAEHATVTRNYGLPKVFMRYAGLGAVSFWVIGTALTVVGKRIGLVLYVLGVLYLLYGLWFSRAVPRRLWRKTPGVQGPQRLVFTEDGVTIRTDANDKTDRWESYRQAFERDGWYLLCRTRRIATVFIPKRAFLSPEDEAIFRALVRSHAHGSLSVNPELDLAAEPPTPAD